MQRELCVGWHLFTLPHQTHSNLHEEKCRIKIQHPAEFDDIAVTYIEKWLDMYSSWIQINIPAGNVHYQTNWAWDYSSCRFADAELNTAHLNQICLYSRNLNLHGVGGGGHQQVYNQAASELTVQFCYMIDLCNLIFASRLSPPLVFTKNVAIITVSGRFLKSVI